MGAAVQVNVFGSNEEMLAKLQAGGSGWDVFVPTNYTITTYVYPFDESFQRLEDVELSFRLAADGRPLVFVPDARARHRHPETLRALVRRKFNYARYAFPLYRQYPGKVAADSSTPTARRVRLVSLAVFLALLPFAWLHPAAGALALAALLVSVAGSGPLLARAFAESPAFGLASAAFLFAGNLAFVAGAARGLLAGRPPEAN